MDFKANSNGNDELGSDNSENEIGPGDNKQKRKRRSKNDAEGRSYKCSDCGKSYLSQPALTNHRKTKHNYGADGERKGRGRPRKNPPITQIDTSEKKFKSFYENPIRKQGNEPVNLEYSKECFAEIFEKYNKVFEGIKSHSDHTFFKLMISQWIIPHEIIPTADGKPQANIACDDILCNYMKETANKANKDYFHFIFKFIILFRECINKVRKQGDSTDEYTQINNAETVPDTCNDFIIDFMEPNDYYGLDMNELIEAIQHLCYWLYVNNYTTSRLTLL